MCTQTRENWNENRHDLRRAIQQTPMIKNLRFRKAIDDTKKNVIALETLTKSPSEVALIIPAKTLVTNLRKRARSPDAPDSPRGFLFRHHQIPKTFDFNERSEKPLTKKLAFDSFNVSKVVHTFEKLALKSQEKPNVVGWTPNQSELDTNVFKIPQAPPRRSSAQKTMVTQGSLPAVDVNSSFSARRSREDDAQSDASYYTCSGRFSSVESLPPQTVAAEPIIPQISKDSDVSLEMEFAGSGEPQLNFAFCVKSAPVPAENKSTIEDCEIDEQRKSMLKTTSGLDSTFQVEYECNTIFSKYSEPQEVSPDLPSNRNDTFNINSGSQNVTPVVAHPNANETFSNTGSQNLIPVLAPSSANVTSSIVSEVQKAFSSGPNPNAIFDVPTFEVPLEPTPDTTFVSPTPKKAFQFGIPFQDSSDEDSFINCHNEALNETLDNTQINPRPITEMSVKMKSEYGFGNQTNQIIGGTPSNPNQTNVAQIRSKAFPADQEIPDHDLISETNMDTYDITLYEDWDEENSHRAAKVLPGWAADQIFLTQQLYVLNPSFLNKNVDAFIFPEMPKFQLFPGATDPRRRP